MTTHTEASRRTKGRRAARRASVPPRVVLITRPTELDWLLRRHATLQQARFFLEQRGQSMDEVQLRHEQQQAAVHRALGAIPADWRRATAQRADLSRFLFEPADIVVIVGQDGLVANVAKYLDGQRVIGLNPDPDRYEGILVHHAPDRVETLYGAAVAEAPDLEVRTMVKAELDDGRKLLALNEVFIGHVSHQSARYEIAFGGSEESHSSSGLIVSTGTGSTGWARSIARSRRCALDLPRPEDRQLVFFVREAWPSVATQADLVEGLIGERDALAVVSRMETGGVVFGDGIESDRIELRWGQTIRVSTAERRLHLLR
ncbi:MAG: hypothetical protein QNJ98_10900 [Planctomycetota bacterium]|nr:hypothetical protein [Planctomycetota bacterium]